MARTGEQAVEEHRHDGTVETVHGRHVGHQRVCHSLWDVNRAATAGRFLLLLNILGSNGLHSDIDVVILVHDSNHSNYIQSLRFWGLFTFLFRVHFLISSVRQMNKQ